MSGAESFPNYLDVDCTDGEGETSGDYPSIEDKIEKAIKVTERSLEQYENPTVMWTGGEGSTLTFYFIKEVAECYSLGVPPAVFIGHYQHFGEIVDFVEHWAEEQDLDVTWVRDGDVGTYVGGNGLEPGDDIPVSELSERNQHHVHEILEYREDTFPFLLGTYIDNHLLKTVALNDTLEEHDIDGIISGVHWDEQGARADETFFSPRHDPDICLPHNRIQPILQFEENTVWGAFQYFAVPDTVESYPEDGCVSTSGTDLPEGVAQEDMPISPKYFAGLRSLGSEVSTDKPAEEPARLQDIENTTKRAGHVQDKEDLMEHLRDLGYV